MIICLNFQNKKKVGLPSSLSTTSPSSLSLNSSLLSHLEKQKSSSLYICWRKEKQKQKMAVVSLVVSTLLFMSSMWMMAEARIPGVYTGGAWQNAHATFYGGSDASGTMGIFSVSFSFSDYAMKSFIFTVISSYIIHLDNIFSFFFFGDNCCRRSLWLWKLV